MIGALKRLRGREAGRGELALALGGNLRILRIFEITGLVKVFPCGDSLAQALVAVAAASPQPAAQEPPAPRMDPRQQVSDPLYPRQRKPDLGPMTVGDWVGLCLFLLVMAAGPLVAFWAVLTGRWP